MRIDRKSENSRFCLDMYPLKISFLNIEKGRLLKIEQHAFCERVKEKFLL